jgi:hypothetical protein
MLSFRPRRGPQPELASIPAGPLRSTRLYSAAGFAGCGFSIRFTSRRDG